MAMAQCFHAAFYKEYSIAAIADMLFNAAKVVAGSGAAKTFPGATAIAAALA